MTSPARTLFIALDACDPDLARRLAGEGHLPVLARLLRTAAVARTETPPKPFVDAVWPTLFTACGVERHGYHGWAEASTGSRRPAEPPFWETVSRAGRKVAVVDVPHAPLTEGFDGIQLADWGSHDRLDRTRSWPPDLLSELIGHHGEHPVGCAGPILRSGENPGRFTPCDMVHRSGMHRTEVEVAHLVADLRLGQERKAALSLGLLRRGGWDLFATVLGEARCAGHQLWHLHDTGHPRHSPELAARLGDPVLDIYQRLDATLGDHLAALGPDATAFVLLTHGMGPRQGAAHLLDALLARLSSRADGTASRDRRSAVIRTGTGLLPLTFRRRVLASLARLRAVEDTTGSPSPLQWQPWRVVPSDHDVGGVRLNLAGRDLPGVIEPDEHQDVCRWLRARLREVVDLDTRRPIVTDVVVADDVYDRDADDALPDLLVHFADDSPVERVWSPYAGTVTGRATHWRTGADRPGGLLLVQRPGIAPGERREPVRGVDVAPTVAASIGCALPGVDGRPVHRLVGDVIPTAAGPWRRRSAVRRVRGAAGAAERLRRRLTAGQRATEELRRQLSWLHAALAFQIEDLKAFQMLADVYATAAWIANVTVPEELCISVVMPTRNRALLLRRAIQSVLDQTYSRWELLVVDDCSDDDTNDVIRSFDDPRVRALRGDGRGCASARNHALDVARGDMVTYLDDDNRFDPGWLKAVAWAFTTNTALEVAYGARVFDRAGEIDPSLDGSPRGEMPRMSFVPWDRAALEHWNRIDMNVLAHRRALGARFDERFDQLADWDLVLKLTEGREAAPIPVVAAYYTTTAPDRLTITTAGRVMDQWEEVLKSMAARRRRAT